MPEIPYQDDQVIEILIDGAPDWIPIKRGSMKAIEVGTSHVDINRTGITAIEQYNGAEVFFYADRLAAVKYSAADTDTNTPTADGRLLP